MRAGLGTVASAIPSGIPDRARSGDQATIPTATASRIETLPSMRSWTVGTNVAAAMTARARSTIASPRVTRTTPHASSPSRAASQIPPATGAATHVAGTERSAARGE